MNDTISMSLELPVLILIQLVVAHLEEKYHSPHRRLLLLPWEQLFDWAGCLHWIIQQGIWDFPGGSLWIDLLPESGIWLWYDSVTTKR
jgi:hypothetical protein